MKRISTYLAKSVVYLVGVAALSVCFILLPELAREESVGKQTNPYMTGLFLVTAYIIATPFFVALYQTLKFLKHIDDNNAFSVDSVKVLQQIKLCVIIFNVLVITAAVSGLIIARIIEPTEDVTFVFTFVFICTFISSIIAVFVAVLQKLLQDAIDLKSENDLIV
jgi:hypothetical protein